MKQILPIALLLSFTSILHADSKRTAEFLLSDPYTYQGKEVTLDVAMVKPVHWVSPFPELAFFHALTIDRTDDKRGGGILVAIPSGESAKFAKKYGTDFEGRNHKTTLRGTFVAAGGGHRPKIWVIDTTGKLLQLIEERKKDLPDGAMDNGSDQGFGPGKGPKPPRRQGAL